MTAPYALADADQMEPTLEARTPDAPQETPPDPSGVAGGWWLDHPDEKQVRTAVLDEWKRGESMAKKRRARAEAYALMRQGVRGVQIVPDEDEDSFSVRPPLSGGEQKRAPGKADGLIRRIAATLTVDPPAPDVTPTSDDDDERQAATLTERVLKVEGAPSQRDDASMLRRAIDAAGTTASQFLYTSYDPQAQLIPTAIQATRTAQTTDDALLVSEMAPGMPDPMTGMPTPGQMVQREARPEELIERFVRLDGTLTDVPAEARLRWQGEIRERLMGPYQVRMIPVHGTTHVEDAVGVLLGDVLTLSEVIGRYFGGERPSEDVVRQLCGWKPDGWEHWVPKALREACSQKLPTLPDGTVSDTALVPVICLYLHSSPMAPMGAYLCIGGTPEPLVRQPWRVQIGEGRLARTVHLPLPIAQLRWQDDADEGDPYGISGMHEMAPAEDIRSSALKYALDYMWRFAKPQMFLPFGTTLQPGQMERREPVHLGPEGTPFFEPLPPFAPIVQQLYADMGTELQAASGLNDATATGKAPSNVTSGKQMQELVEQSLVAMAGLQQNVSRFICRVWANRAEFMRAFYDTPRVLDYLGEGGDTQRQAWMGADLIGAGDVQIARGTGTMLPRSAKAALAREELQLAQTTGDQLGAARYYKSVLGNTTPLVGMQDDPHRSRIERQLRAWRDAAFQNYPPADPQVDPMTGQPMPDPIAQQAAQVFAPNPSDEVPAVAQIRFMELVDAIASRRTEAADPRYQQVLAQEFERMRAAAGVMTVAEQQEAQQAAAQSQQQAEAAKEQAKSQARTQERVQLKQAEAAIDAQMDDRRAALDMAREQQAMAAQMVRPTMAFPEEGA
jgi:hypothetical protein